MFDFPENSWRPIFDKAKSRGFFDKIELNLLRDISDGNIIFPPPSQILRAFEVCDFQSLKLVFLGQDPYHGSGEANGLCFSVNEGVKIPPSLRNIFKELKLEYPTFDIERSTDLSDWAQQGVLMLNSILTVEKDKAASHSRYGWEELTDFLISEISYQKDHVVFILLGKYAQSKLRLIDQRRHTIITGIHPSPLSAHRGFFGSNIFQMCNQKLKEKGETEIVWG